MRSEWEEKAYINPHSSSGSRTLETDTEQEQQTDLKSFSPVSSSTSTSRKCGFGGLTHLVKNFVLKRNLKTPSPLIQTGNLTGCPHTQ